jgi:hypothetical protein
VKSRSVQSEISRREEERERERTETQNKITEHNSKINTIFHIHSPNLLKPHNPPLPFIAITTHIQIHRTTLPSTLLSLLKPALPSLSRFPSPPLAKLMFALLTACLSDGGSRSEAYTVDAFAVVAERAMDFVTGDLRVLPGEAADVWFGLVVIFWGWFDRGWLVGGLCG